MQTEQPVLILWDASHIWGLMAWRALRALGLSCRLVKGKEIAEGALLGKPHPKAPSAAPPADSIPNQNSGLHEGRDAGSSASPAAPFSASQGMASAADQTAAPAHNRPPLLVVPGGNAKLKALALGHRGREAIREYLAQGGSYLGFCGGAGLALSHHRPDDGLNLCPWSRASYPSRVHHLISGHVLARSCDGHALAAPAQRAAASSEQALRQGAALTVQPEAGAGAGQPAAPAAARTGGQQASAAGKARGQLSLPVWWPGRFAPEASETVQVLASYDAPDADFWLADLPLRSIPDHVFEAWQALYGINLSADFLSDQPLVVSGTYGRGRYVLSYSHLETPASPDANAWLVHLLRSLAGLQPERELVPGWELDVPPCAWPQTDAVAPLQQAVQQSHALMELAVEQHLFFRRAPWLWGWRTGLPGAACNNLHAALCTALSLAPSAAALDYWQEVAPRFAELSTLLSAGAEGYFLACRLAETLSPTLPDAVDKKGLLNQREALFGHPMQGGGLIEELLTLTEELIYLSQDSPLLL